MTCRVTKLDMSTSLTFSFSFSFPASLRYLSQPSILLHTVILEIHAEMVFYIGSMPPSCFFLGSEFSRPKIPDHRLESYCPRYKISNKMTPLDPASRFKLVMKRQHISSFLDPNQEVQSEMDLDLLLLWEEMQERVEDQHITAYHVACR